MPASGLYRAFVSLELALGVATFVGLRLIRAPYGRYVRGGWGPTIPARLGWLLMESPACLVFVGVYAAGPHRGAPVPLVLLGLWQVHYAHRAFVYPLRLRGGGRMPLAVAGLAVTFNVLNASINARWVSAAGDYPLRWLADPRFLAGAALFLFGLGLNLSSDHTLRSLRGPGETGYKVPRGGAFGCRAPTTSARSSSGAAGRWPPGRCRAWRSRSTPRRTWCPGRCPTTTGTGSGSSTTRPAGGP